VPIVASEPFMRHVTLRLERFRALCAQVRSARELTPEERHAADTLAHEVALLAAEFQALSGGDVPCPNCPSGPMRPVFQDRTVAVYVCEACTCSLSVPPPEPRRAGL
jgi:hypothetical protein